ncbi:MAG TPA: flavin-dependent oxidoreductase [Sphingomonas sp.]
MRIVISGAGIGGLTAALSLQKAGIDVTVHEAVTEIAPMGVGINILPHAARELIDLGLEEAIDRFAIRTTAMRYYAGSGELVIGQPCGLHAGYRWPQWSMLRGDLQMLLLDTFRARAGADKVVSGAKLVDFADLGPGKVVARFQDSHDPRRDWTVECDALIGADGLHSATRRKLYPDEGAPVYSGLVLYRSAALADQFLDGRTMVIIGDRRLKLVAYPISKVALERNEGKSLVNWIAALAVDRADAPPEDWNTLSTEDRLRARYDDWKFDWIDVPALMAASDRVFEFPVYDRDPLDRWTFGRVTLLGDAAHPLIPVSSNGAVQAIIDGRALAYALAAHGKVEDGLEAYEADRLERANAVVRSSRANGPDEVLELARRRTPPGAASVHDHVSQAELQAIIDDFKERAGFGIETLNARRSYDVPAVAG